MNSTLKPDTRQMGFRVVELGPFGCRIYWGTVENLEDIPKGYIAKRIKAISREKTVYIEPVQR
jgi:hypothetical protein